MELHKVVYVEQYISAGGHPCMMRLWAFQILSLWQHYLVEGKELMLIQERNQFCI